MPMPVTIPMPDDGGDIAACLRQVTAAGRHLDNALPARQLLPAARQTLRLAAQLDTGDGPRRDLSAAHSEARSFLAWLSWDAGDVTAARDHYGQAIQTARDSGHQLLHAYQLGSLAQFEARLGNPVAAITAADRTRRALGPDAPAVAHAWAAATEALAHAAAGDATMADEALARSRDASVRIPEDTPVPWPWLGPFDHHKVAAARISCGALLGRPEWVTGAVADVPAALSTPHVRQRALLTLDLAAGLLAAGDVDEAFTVASEALRVGAETESHRLIHGAAVLRGQYTGARLPRCVADFDEQLAAVL
ncbi:DNA-binding protein [Streptomyces jumonjinensis]|uniref:DNA-binding protein n=1 Tax=Streptomyces jumonjinensis TaxID=1945 RepID=UPI00331BD608